jgi:hypothetical protein
MSVAAFGAVQLFVCNQTPAQFFTLNFMPMFTP